MPLNTEAQNMGSAWVLSQRVTDEDKERSAELRLYLKEKEGNKTKFIIMTYKSASST